MSSLLVRLDLGFSLRSSSAAVLGVIMPFPSCQRLVNKEQRSRWERQPDLGQSTLRVT